MAGALGSEPLGTAPLGGDETVPLEAQQKKAGVLVTLGYVDDKPAVVFTEEGGPLSEELLESYRVRRGQKKRSPPQATPQSQSAAAELLTQPPSRAVAAIGGEDSGNISRDESNAELINGLEQQETALREIAAEMATIRVELTALAERDRFGVGGNGPPEQINIDEAIEHIEDGARSARLLRAAVGDDLVYLGTELVSALGKLCYNALNRAWSVVDNVRRWLLGKAEKFVDAFAVGAGTSIGKVAGPAAFLILLQQTGIQPLEYLQKLADFVNFRCAY